MTKKNSFEVKTWKNGQPTETGAGYGIRIAKNDYAILKDWEEIIIEKNKILRNNDRKFTEKCPEIRSKIIGIFLIKNQLNNWEKGQPKKLILLNVGENKFELILE